MVILPGRIAPRCPRQAEIRGYTKHGNPGFFVSARFSGSPEDTVLCSQFNSSGTGNTKYEELGDVRSRPHRCGVPYPIKRHQIFFQSCCQDAPGPRTVTASMPREFNPGSTVSSRLFSASGPCSFSSTLCSRGPVIVAASQRELVRQTHGNTKAAVQSSAGFVCSILACLSKIEQGVAKFSPGWARLVPESAPVCGPSLAPLVPLQAPHAAATCGHPRIQKSSFWTISFLRDV